VAAVERLPVVQVAIQMRDSKTLPHGLPDPHRPGCQETSSQRTWFKLRDVAGGGLLVCGEKEQLSLLRVKGCGTRLSANRAKRPRATPNLYVRERELPVPSPLPPLTVTLASVSTSGQGICCLTTNELRKWLPVYAGSAYLPSITCP